MVMLVRYAGRTKHALSFDDEPYQTGTVLWYTRMNQMFDLFQQNSQLLL